MYCRLHCHGHEYLPDHRVDVDLWHVVSQLTTKFLSYIQVNFLNLANILCRDNLVPMEFFVVSATGLPALVIVFESECHTWELEAMFSFEPLATGLSSPTRSEFERCPPNVPGLFDALEPSVVGGWLASFDTKLIIVFDFATARSFSPSFSSCLILFYMVWELLIGLKWLQENIEKNSWCWTHEEDDLTHHGWSCLSSIGLRFGFWCRHIWFWILVSQLILSTTNQTRPCRFGIRVSSSEFGLQWWSWSLLHCLQVKHGFEVNRFCVCDDVIHIRFSISARSWCWCVCFGFRLATGFAELFF